MWVFVGVSISKQFRVNDEIRSREVMLIDADGKSLGKVGIDQALWLAAEAELDLVEVGPSATPPVTRLLDYGKYQYEQAKAESKSRTHAPEVKEIRMKLKIGEHDFQVKRSQADKWLTDGDRVRVTIILYGREMIFQEKAGQLVERMRAALDATIESPLTRQGKRFTTMLARKKTLPSEQ